MALPRLSAALVGLLAVACSSSALAQRGQVIEGESLVRGRPAARATAGQISAQDMKGFGNQWSGGAQLFWGAEKRGDRLELPISTATAGDYTITAFFTQAPDFGQIHLELNGHALSTFDGYAPQVTRSEAVVLSGVPLNAGQNTLSFVVSGKNRQSSGHFVGFDQLTFDSTPSVARPVVGNIRRPGAVVGESGQLTIGPVETDAVMASLPKVYFGVLPYEAPKMKPLSGSAAPPLNADLRPFIQQNQLAIRNQGNRGTCSVFATTFSIEYALTKAYGKGFADLSEEFLNAVGNMASGKTDDGDFFHVLNKGYQKYGLCAEIFMKYQPTMASPPNANQLHLANVWKRLQPDFIKPWNNTNGLTDAQFNKVLSYLDQGLPVAAGMWWPQKGFFQLNVVQGVDLMADPGKANVVDGHSVSLVGYAKSPQFPGGGFFVFRNSWGTAFGDQGYGYVGFDYIKKYTNDLLVFKLPTD